MANIKNLRFDAFVTAIKGEAQPLFLTGYVGEAENKDFVRVYSDASLSSYVEFKKDDVLHAVPNAPEEDTLGGSKIWLKNTAKLTFGNDYLETKSKDAFTKGEVMNYFQNRMYEGNITPQQAKNEIEKMKFTGCVNQTGDICFMGTRVYYALQCVATLGCMGGSVMEPYQQMTNVINPVEQFRQYMQNFRN